MARLISTSSVRSLFAKNISFALRRTVSSPPAARAPAGTSFPVVLLCHRRAREDAY
jgi:hypothetical protein